MSVYMVVATNINIHHGSGEQGMKNKNQIGLLLQGSKPLDPCECGSWKAQVLTSWLSLEVLRRLQGCFHLCSLTSLRLSARAIHKASIHECA